MEAATGGVLHAASQVAQAGAEAYKGLTGNTAPLKCTFTRIRAPPLPRSSHTATVVKGRVYIFGGEIKPREPVDNAMHMVILPTTGAYAEADYQKIEPRPTKPDAPIPAPRVGHSASAIGDKIYIFGGRGGADMTALEEHGRVWVFDTTAKTWDYVDPNPDSPFPEARSYHTSAASDRPLPLHPPPSLTASSTATDEIQEPTPTSPALHANYAHAPTAHGTLFIHAGCTSAGPRASDLWALDLSAASWSPFPTAPGPARGGTSLALVHDRLYRAFGFDGTRELGGHIDRLDLASGTFADKAGTGEMALAPGPAGWQSDAFATARAPPPRSVAGFVPVTTGQGRHFLVIFGGETAPSAQGHAGAGRFLGDVWSWQLRPEGATAASVTDAVRGVLLGRETGERAAVRAELVGEDGASVPEGEMGPMGARGWFAADRLEGGAGFVVWGGLDAANERCGDGWVVQVE